MCNGNRLNRSIQGTSKRMSHKQGTVRLSICHEELPFGKKRAGERRLDVTCVMWAPRGVRKSRSAPPSSCFVLTKRAYNGEVSPSCKIGEEIKVLMRSWRSQSNKEYV